MKTDITRNQPPACPACHRPLPEGAPQGLCPTCLLAGAAAATEAGQSPTAAHVPSMERLATAFPQLEILGLIGSGGMGSVFKARQKHLDRMVALKVLSETLAANPAFIERFDREARVLARLNHPNIVTLFDFGQADGLCYLLMEYVDGVNLRQALQAGKFSGDQALALVPKICEALQFAHEEGVLHRDIKPGNILLDTRGRVKIADFGIAKLLGEVAAQITLTDSNSALGTPAYMAPEQLERRSDVDHRADIYSLGVVFYEMLTGELPLGRFAPPSKKALLDERVDEIVLRALAKERELRQQSAAEVKTQVEVLSGVGQPLPSAPVPTASTPRRWNRKAMASAVVMALSVPAAAIGLFVLFLGAGTMEPVGTVMPVWRRLVFLLPILIFAGLAFGGFVMGLLAIRDIRRTRSESGIGFAWMAVLAWPLVAMLAGLPVGMYALAARNSHSSPATDLAVNGRPSSNAVPTTASAPRKRTSAEEERFQIRVDMAKGLLREIEARLQVGKATSLEVAGAKLNLALVEASGRDDKVGAARAQYEHSVTLYNEFRNRVEVGAAAPSDLRNAEAEMRLRKVDLDEAIRIHGGESNVDGSTGPDRTPAP